MATPSCESDGLSRKKYLSAWWSRAVSPPWNSSTILLESRIGSTPLISWVSGPITPLMVFVSIWFTAVTPSATSQPVSPVTSWTLRLRTPPAVLTSLWATLAPWIIAWPRLASRPVKQERTRWLTGPDELLLLPPDPLLEDAHAASRTAAAQEPTDLLIMGCFTVVLLYPVPAARRHCRRLVRPRPLRLGGSFQGAAEGPHAGLVGQQILCGPVQPLA